MKKHVLGASWALAVVLSLGACGDDDSGSGDNAGEQAGGGGGGLNGGGSNGGGANGGSGSNGGKLVKDLSAAEAKALCESIKLPVLTKQETCNFSVLISDDKESCEETRDFCLENDLPLEDEENDCSDTSALSTCEATVKEVKDCYEAYVEQILAVSELSCDDAGKISFEEFTSTPEACRAFEEKCPSAFDEEE